GATESDNLAIKGVANFYQKKGKHIITCKTEHKAVLDTCRHLERDGFEVTYLDPDSNGLIPLERIENAMRDDTTLVSI
ncbi:aminotransferase class V-fold PLP-dependent enzyme, partial [Shewanella sp. A25]|nr:aminotransferase class V-fold PLP-dependent enzyme [Shewanella shenzhenensis]